MLCRNIIRMTEELVAIFVCPTYYLLEAFSGRSFKVSAYETYSPGHVYMHFARVSLPSLQGFTAMMWHITLTSMLFFLFLFFFACLLQLTLASLLPTTTRSSSLLLRKRSWRLPCTRTSTSNTTQRTLHLIGMNTSSAKRKCFSTAQKRMCRSCSP